MVFKGICKHVSSALTFASTNSDQICASTNSDQICARTNSDQICLASSQHLKNTDGKKQKFQKFSACQNLPHIKNRVSIKQLDYELEISIA